MPDSLRAVGAWWFVIQPARQHINGPFPSHTPCHHPPPPPPPPFHLPPSQLPPARIISSLTLEVSSRKLHSAREAKGAKRRAPRPTHTSPWQSRDTIETRRRATTSDDTCRLKGRSSITYRGRRQAARSVGSDCTAPSVTAWAEWMEEAPPVAAAACACFALSEFLIPSVSVSGVSVVTWRLTRPRTAWCFFFFFRDLITDLYIDIIIQVQGLTVSGFPNKP